MRITTRVIVGIVGGALALALILSATGVAYAVTTGRPLFGGTSTVNQTYGPGMMGNGGSYGPGMMGTGGSYGPGMMGSRNWSVLDGQTPVATNQVVMTNQDAFSPAVIQVRAETIVTWTNTDTDTHTVTFMPAMFASGNVVGGAKYSVTFSTPGTYNYFCMYHPGMVGRVIVTNG